MHVNIRSGRRVISPNGIDYKDRLIGVCYTKDAKFQGNLEKLGFVEVLKLDNEQRINEQRIYKEVNEANKNDFKDWLLKWSNNNGIYGDEKIVVGGMFRNYRLGLKPNEVISSEWG